MNYPTKTITVPDVDQCRKEVLEWMRTHNITYREMAGRCSLATSNLYDLLHGKRNLNIPTIEKLYRVISVKR